MQLQRGIFILVASFLFWVRGAFQIGFYNAFLITMPTVFMAVGYQYITMALKERKETHKKTLEEGDTTNQKRNAG